LGFELVDDLEVSDLSIQLSLSSPSDGGLPRKSPIVVETVLDEDSDDDDPMDIDYIDNEAIIDVDVHMLNVEMNHNDDMNVDMNDAEECHNCHCISAIFEEDRIKDDEFELYRVTIESCNDVVIKFHKKFSSIWQRDYNHEEPLLLCHE